MTIGIVLTNGREIVAVADSLHTNQTYNQTTCTNPKLVPTNETTYAAVLLGSGNMTHLSALSDHQGQTAHASLEEYVRSLQEQYSSLLGKKVHGYIESGKYILNQRAQLIMDDAERKAYEQQQIKALATNVEQYSRSEESSFLVAGIEKGSAPEIFNFNSISINQLGYHVQCIGIPDPAISYFMRNNYGIRPESLGLADMILLAVNAETNASLSPGVGGIPTIAYILPTEEGAKATTLPKAKAVALANISAAHMADHPKASFEDARRYFQSILEESRPSYADIGKQFGFRDAKSFTSIYVPFSSRLAEINPERFQPLN